MAESSTTETTRAPLTMERLDHLVERLSFKFDDAEQTAALIELLCGIQDAPSMPERENFFDRAIQRAFIYTPEFQRAVEAYTGRERTEETSGVN